ncbi:hypothetical protein [Kordiimonas sp. SCSIO 12610]|uniref:hypothetical protein n=1 Tax=Kordiimonas sp. SCSIO 12610 TaxID=2829597 RepID=UPI0021088FA6|nr:hypothetical protein [Kordiimonas sp. SCSIO 12610]UTW56203.1 hypothetical protein KFF44_04705 [Kordiimonas sp. SCSIO 12610]
MPNGSNHPISHNNTPNHNTGQNTNGQNANGPSPNGPNGSWTVNKQIDLLKVLALFIAAVGAYFTLKSDTEALRDGLARAEGRINKLEVAQKDEGAEMARLAVLEAQQRMSEQSLGEIKQTLKAIDKKVDDMRKEIRAN